MTRALLLAGLVSITAVSPSPHRSVSLKVSPTVSAAPAKVKIRVMVTPLEDQRVLRVVAFGEKWGRSSDTQLDGLDGPGTVWIDWRDIPSGTYDLNAYVATTSAVVATAAQQFIVQ